MLTVSDKVALVTGGASGIGLAITKKILVNGAKGVAIVDINSECGEKALNEIEATFGTNKAIFLKINVTIKEELENAFEKTIETFQNLDIVVNNAGIANEIDWKKTISVNFVSVVESTYLAMQKYLPKYKSGHEGVIVNTASILGLQSVVISPMYCSTKHALVGFGKALGGEEFYKKYQVRLLTLCPGVTKTQMGTSKETKMWFPEKTLELLKLLSREEQEPDVVDKAVIEIIAKGKTGSLWVIEDNEPAYEVVVPDRKSMKV